MSTEQRVVFASGFESLFSRDLRAQVTPELDRELKACGVFLDKPFQAAYSIETWAAAVEATAKHLFPGEARPVAYWKLGRSTIEGFAETLIGRASFGFLRLVGPVRSVERAARTYASTNNYTKVTLNRVGPTSFDFHLNEKHTLPEYDMGVVEGVLEHVGAKTPVVTLSSQDPEGFTLRLEWTS